MCGRNAGTSLPLFFFFASLRSLGRLPSYQRLCFLSPWPLRVCATDDSQQRGFILSCSTRVLFARRQISPLSIAYTYNQVPPGKHGTGLLPVISLSLWTAMWLGLEANPGQISAFWEATSCFPSAVQIRPELESAYTNICRGDTQV